LFHKELFCRRLIVFVVDEAHVIYTWSKGFRIDYGELRQLRVITGVNIPRALFSATFPTEIFNFCGQSLWMGSTRPLWGIDLGADQLSIMQWVRPMEYPINSFA
ncbi:hypothetical protein C8Q72DRAFT_743674, partial [Fomitopsis betulina]